MFLKRSVQDLVTFVQSNELEQQVVETARGEVVKPSDSLWERR
ncbi:hypothetical protein A2U01_0070227, partial [Trifolium medium]|nr:hypothetical protein [Trifolium medium]